MKTVHMLLAFICGMTQGLLMVLLIATERTPPLFFQRKSNQEATDWLEVKFAKNAEKIADWIDSHPRLTAFLDGKGFTK